MKIYYFTFGCKVNQYETENIAEAFAKQGFGRTDDMQKAGVCVINTCTVTQMADQKCRQLVHRIKKVDPTCIVILAGCFPQAFEKAAEAMFECDIIVGTDGKGRIPQLLKEFLVTGRRIVEIKPHHKGEEFEPMQNLAYEGKTRAYIKIQDGCDCYCTYCIIPFARGHIRSKPIEAVVEEARKLISAGHKEIILTGINLCCYGRDLAGQNITLIDAVERVCALEGGHRVRLGSIEPEMLSENDIQRLAGLDGLCPHFHLSLQSGCDATLKRMNRRYTSAEYAALCERLRRYFPECAITTDIMVGFPQESEEEFGQSLEFARRIGFAEAHIFPFSSRQGTAAAKMSGQISKGLKHSRAGEMARVCEASQAEYLAGCVGKVFKVLFERETEEQWHTGHAENYITVKVERNDPGLSLWRQLRRVKIISTDGKTAYGEIV